MSEPIIYDIGSPGRSAVRMPEIDVPLVDIPPALVRDRLDLPEVSELDIVRHYTRLSHLNFAIDSNFYPLGSCTMKYNPRLNEQVARLPGFARIHPYQDDYQVQGALEVMFQVQEWLKEIGGFAGVSLQPAAGAHGELTGVLMIRAYHRDRGDHRRTKMLIPNSAHGTNPATTTMAGLETVELPSDRRGNVDLEALRQACDDTIAGLMITNPNTLGLFEEHVVEVIGLVHQCGGLIYGDGANFNALMGIVKPGELGIDVMHYNLHKTFSTPHGGGGPGSGPVGVSSRLLPFLPAPIVERRTTDTGEAPYHFVRPEKTIGQVKVFYGNFGMHVRTFAYMLSYGGDGLRTVSEMAVLNANYLMSKLRGTFRVPFDRPCMHEFVVEGHLPGIEGVHALDISKRLIDYGFHPPTNYFPLIVHEALMIEPTETESKETLDAFAEALLAIVEEARINPELLHQAPHTAPVGRLDEVQAARQLVLCCRPISVTA